MKQIIYIIKPLKVKSLILCCFFIFLGVINTRAQQTNEVIWTSTVVDSVIINNKTLIGIKNNNSKGHCYYKYYIKELKAKRDSIHASKKNFGIYGNSPIWENYWKFEEEFKKHSAYVNQLFENNHNGIPLNQLGVSVDILIDEDGSSFCYKITATMMLTNVFSESELVDIIEKIGRLKYSTPLVKKPRHGYLEYEYLNISHTTE